MGVDISAEAWKLPLPTGDKIVLLALADHADKDTRLCWPTIPLLCAKTGKSKRSLQQSLRSLSKAGYIVRRPKYENGLQVGVLYTVLPAVAEFATGGSNFHHGEDCQGGEICRDRVAQIAPKPSETIISVEAVASTPRASSRSRVRFNAPEGVSPEQWFAFCKQRRKPLEERAYTLIRNKLRAFAQDGFPPGELIDLAIERGWETVFKPKEERNGERSRNEEAFRAVTALGGAGATF